MPQVFSWSDDEFDDRARGLAALIRRVWRAIARQVAANVEQQKAITMAAANPIPTQWQQAVDDQIIGFVRNVYLDAAGGISDALNAPDELLVGDDLVEVYTNAARNRLVGIGDDVWKNVQAQITLGNQLGDGIPEIAERIRNVAGVSEARSLTIARTEVHAAFESGSYEQAMFVDPKGEKVWLATEDERTRPSHRAADGQRVKIGESFDVGGSKLRFPGDPLGAPEDCINCRCSVAYDFDMITTVVDEPEPAMVAAGEQMWKAHQHPRGNDGKFIKSGIVADFLKKDKPNIVDVAKAVGNLDSQQWGKLTDAQKTHIKSSVDKLPKGTITHNNAQKTLDSLEKSAPALASPKPKTKIGETYAKLKDAKHGDVLATGTKYSSSGVVQKFKITADKSHVHPDYMPHGKMKLEFLKKNGEPSDKSYTGGILSINQKLHPLPMKGKKPGKVEWDEPGTTVAPEVNAPEVNAPEVNAPDFAPNPPKPGPKAAATETKIPAGLKGAPGDPAKITTGVVWGKHPAGTTIVQSEDGMDRIVWNGKKYEFQTQDDIGDWATQFEMSKKDFYAQHKEDTAWKIPGGEKTHQPLDLNTPEMDQAFGDPNAPDVPTMPDEALGHEMTPDEVDFFVTQWERENAAKATSEPPQTPSTPPVSTTTKPDWTKAQDFSGFTKVGGQAGSNPGGKYKAPDGTEWYLKKPKSAQHAANEMAAAAFYNLAGVDAPQVMKGKGAPELGNPQTGTKIVPGANANLGSKLNDEAYLKQIQSGFAMDAWLANWDVAGMGYDNVVEGADGKPHRIDVGGALLYRAQGEPKGSAFGDTVDELTTLRDGTNPQSAKVFGSMTDEDIRKSAAKLEAISNEQIDQIVADAGLPYSVAQTLKNRRAHILSKYPPISEADELLNEVLGPTGNPNSPWADTDKDKLKQYYQKGLITTQEYIDAAGENPDGSDPYGGVADKGVLLNDLESGAILPMSQAIDLGIMLNESDYNDLSNMEKDQLETSLSTAADMDMLGGKDAYAHWQSLHNTPSAPSAPDTSDDHALPVADGPMISGSSLGLKALHNLIVGNKADGKYTDGQVVAVSPDGTKQIVHRANLNGYVMRFTDTGAESFMNNLSAIKKIRDDDYRVPESALPNHGGTLIGDTPPQTLTPIGQYFDDPNMGTLIHAVQSLTPELWSTFTPAEKKQFTDDADKWLGSFTSLKTKITDFNAKDAGEPASNDPLTNDVDSIGVTNAQALLALHHGDTDKLVTIDGEWEIYKSPNGKWTALKQNHSNDTSTITLLDDNDTADLEKTAGLQVWYPQDAVDSAKDSTSGTAGQPLDPDVIQEKIDLGEYTAGEVVAVTEDGQHQLIYSPIVTGLVYQFKVGNTGDPDLDWDTEKVYDGDADTMDTPISEFVDEHPDVKLFEPPNVNVDDDSGSSNVDWNNILSGSYVYNDVVAQTGDGKYQLVHKGMGNYSLYKKDDVGTYSAVSGAYYADDIISGDLDASVILTDAHWAKVRPGTPFKSGKFPAKKAFAKKVAKAAGVPQSYSAAAVTPGEKKFYLDDAEDGALVPAEVIHLLNGAGGLDFSDVKKLTPKQVANIDKQVAKALDAGMAGSGSASLEWSDLKTDITSPSLSQTVDMNYLIDMEDEMWSGDKEFGDIIAVTTDGKYRLMIHSTEGPGENPNSFAVEVNGPYGWEVTNVYSGNPPTKFWDDWHEKPWVIPDSNDDGSGAPDDVLDSASVEFDPPGTGAQLPGTIFDMLDWVPEGKTLLVGKDDNGDKFKMVAGKDINGKKVINVDLWYPSTGKFNGWAQFHNENEYNDYVDDPIKWDAVASLSDKSALDDYMGNPNSPATVPSAPAPVLDSGNKLTSYHSKALWDAVQNLDEDTVVATAVSKNGSPIQMVVKKHAEGHSILSVQKKHPVSGKWGWWYGITDEDHLSDDLGEEDWHNEIDVPGVPNTSAPTAPTAGSNINDMTGTAPNAPIGSSYWGKLTSVKDNVPGGTVVAVHKQSGSVLIKTHDGDWAVEDADGAQVGMSLLYPQDAWSVVPGDWHTPSGTDVTPLTPVIPTAPAPTTPSAPSVSTPPAVKPVPLYKINILKGNMKTDGNVGYWSKPEKIWEQIQKFQKLPGNENFSPIDFLTALDNTLKTDKHSYVTKMTKWAATKKGAQTIGAGGIGGSTTSTPAATSNGGVIDLKPENIDAIWDNVQSLPAGTIFAMSEKGDIRLKVAGGSPGSPKYLIAESKSTMGSWQYYHAGGGTKDKLKKMLENDQNPNSGISPYNWKMVTPSSAATATAPAKKANVPDIEVGNDISGIDAVKQKQVYDAFKANPGTYLNSSQAFENFDAFQSVAKSEGLTLGQVIAIVDEQGAIKVNAPNTNLFKKKIADWLKTPEAAAHILNEPKKVTGLPTPPEFTPEYHPDLHLPSFEESNKYTYDYVKTTYDATKIWKDITAKTKPHSASEQSALKVWTGGAYSSINGHLYAPSSPYSSLSSTHKTAMNGAQKGMRPSDRPMILVRGTYFDGLGNAKTHAQLEKLVGTTWRNNAFAATSVGQAPNDPPGVYSPAFSSLPLWIEFECPPGTPMSWVANFSQHGHEREMLLAADLHYQILSVEKKTIPGYGVKSVARVRIVPKPEGAAE